METQIRALLLKGYTVNEIKYFLKINDEEFKLEFKKLATNLANDTILLKCLLDRDDIAVGKIEISKNGTGYLSFGSKKYVIEQDELHTALDGDLVLVTCEEIHKKKVYKVEEIIERKDGLIVVNFVNGEFVPLSVPFDYEIELSEEDQEKIKPNDRLLVKVNDIKSGKVTASLRTIIGHKDDIALKEKTVAVSHGFHLSFSESVKKELEDIPDIVLPEDFKTHVDMRGEKAFTIDDIDTQDIDDGLFYRRLPNGNHLVGIPLSHVTYYIKDRGAIFNEAIERGNSLYLGKHSEPMLPRKLCNGIGSLNPDEDRLARTVLVEFDEKYNIVDFKIVRSVIRSRKKMTYDAVDRILLDDSVPVGYENFHKELIELNKINQVLELRKIRRGAIEFYSNETKVAFDNRMNPIGFHLLKQSPARKLIENFALLANELYDMYCFDLRIKNINRVEEAPNLEKVNKVIGILNACGFDFSELSDVENQLSINAIMHKIKESEKYPVYSGISLRMMQKAFYTLVELGHYGLALRFYAQFTSPIRRISDFMNHKLIDRIDQGQLINFTEEELEQIAAHASETERNADDASKEMLRIYMAEHMKPFIGESFRGTIIDEGSFGVAVKTDNEVIGRVAPKDIMFGKYRFNSEGYYYYDPKKQSEYHIGDDVNVTLKAVNDNLGTVDFTLVGQYEKPKEKKKVHRNKYRR